jgi:hypothetical protein
MPATKLDLIYERWKASLRDKDRSKDFVSSNFDELFDALNSAGASFDEAHAYLAPAIKVHLPTAALAKAIWRVAKNNPGNLGMSEKEFTESWHKDIGDKATNSFYGVYPLVEDKDEDPEPKVYGSMSAKEYKLQRKHADSYPVLDTEELERRLQSETYDPSADILGEDDDSGDTK